MWALRDGEMGQTRERSLKCVNCGSLRGPAMTDQTPDTIRALEAKVVYERQDGFDMASGPYGYVRVGFAIGDRVFWTGCAGSSLPAGQFEVDEMMAREIVARWNRERTDG